MTELIRPNLHVAILHFPIALLVIGTFIETFSFLGYRKTSFAVAGRWMLLLGSVSIFPTIFTGLYALHQMTAAGTEMPELRMPWAQMVAESRVANHAELWEVAIDHLWISVFAAVGAMTSVFLYLSSGDRMRRLIYLPLLLVLLTSNASLLVSAWHGGELVHKFSSVWNPDLVKVEPNVATVDDIRAGGLPASGELQTIETDSRPSSGPQLVTLQDSPTDTNPPALRDGPMTATTGPATLPQLAFEASRIALQSRNSDSPAESKDGALLPASAEKYLSYDSLIRVAPPLQTHLIFAGLTIGITLVALATSLRAANEPTTVPVAPDPSVDRIAAVFAFEHPPRVMTPAPSGLAWMIALFVAFFALAGGVWVLADDSDIWNAGELWKLVSDPQLNSSENAGDSTAASSLTRRLVHAVTGGLLLLVPIFMGLLARFARRNRAMVVLAGIVIFVILLIQVWLGVLLLFDTNGGSVLKFNALT